MPHKNILKVSAWFVAYCLCHISYRMHVSHTCILRDNSLFRGHLYDEPKYSEVTQKTMGKLDHYQMTTKHNKVSPKLLYIFMIGLHCNFSLWNTANILLFVQGTITIDTLLGNGAIVVNILWGASFFMSLLGSVGDESNNNWYQQCKQICNS